MLAPTTNTASMILGRSTWRIAIRVAPFGTSAWSSVVSWTANDAAKIGSIAYFIELSSDTLRCLIKLPLATNDSVA
jgi:hypothetical protein